MRRTKTIKPTKESVPSVRRCCVTPGKFCTPANSGAAISKLNCGPPPGWKLPCRSFPQILWHCLGAVHCVLWLVNVTVRPELASPNTNQSNMTPMLLKVQEPNKLIKPWNDSKDYPYHCHPSAAEVLHKLTIFGNTIFDFCMPFCLQSEFWQNPWFFFINTDQHTSPRNK